MNSAPGFKWVTHGVLVSVALALCSEAAALEYQWTWEKGSKAANTNEIRGTQNVASPENTPQALSQCGLWQDEGDVVWVYGGIGQVPGSSALEQNDLWKFDPNTTNWAWVWGNDISRNPNYYELGVASVNNWPGARTHAQIWTDDAGNLWLFGGMYSRQCYHDFWKFSLASGLWTWVSGDGRSGIPGNYGTKGIAAAGNYPDGRESAATWKDKDGKLWMFGGMGPVSHMRNDLWRFDPATGYWTWMAGDDTSNTTSTYGLKGIPGPDVKPGGRSVVVEWTDPAGNFWIYGGRLPDGDYTDEVWKYDITLGQWAFMDGTTTGSVSPVYGTRGVSNESNTPGSLAFVSGAADFDGNLLLFGGGIPYQQPSGAIGYTMVNDIWQYDISAGAWTWCGGSQGTQQYGNYGTIGVANTTNWPGSRLSCSAFTDAQDELWVFGGLGRAESTSGYLNDLWKAELVPQASVAGWEIY